MDGRIIKKLVYCHKTLFDDPDRYDILTLLAFFLLKHVSEGTF